MIKSNLSLSMGEATEYIQTDNSELIGFIKKFSDLDLKSSKELRKELSNLESMKIKQEHITKIIELFPDNAEDINKIFTDVGLNEDESKKILEIIKKFK